MSTSTLERPKKTQNLSKLDWEPLLDRALRAARDYELRRQIDAEMKRRVFMGYRSEAFCPMRMFHQ